MTGRRVGKPFILSPPTLALRLRQNNGPTPTGDYQPSHSLSMAGSGGCYWDTVLIKAGTYKEYIDINKSGITISNYRNDKVTLDGKGITLWNFSGLVNLYGEEGNGVKLSGVTIFGLDVINTYSAGFFINNAKKITIKGSSSNNTSSSGIAVWSSDDISIDNNVVSKACSGINYVKGGGGVQIDESITLALTTNSTISNNHVSSNAGPVEDGGYVEGGEGIDVKQGSNTVQVFGNKIEYITGSNGIYIDAWNVLTSNINVYNNEVYGNTSNGIVVASEGGGDLNKVFIHNNYRL